MKAVRNLQLSLIFMENLGGKQPKPDRIEWSDCVERLCVAHAWWYFNLKNTPTLPYNFTGSHQWESWVKNTSFSKRRGSSKRRRRGDEASPSKLSPVAFSLLSSCLQMKPQYKASLPRAVRDAFLRCPQHNGRSAAAVSHTLSGFASGLHIWVCRNDHTYHRILDH